MLPGQPSRTMLRSAIRRAAHQILDAPLIFNDPIVVGLVPEASDPAIRDALDDPGAPDAKLFRCMFAMRNRFAEDRLAQAAARGARQYVIVGAGLDTFAWRQPAFAKTMQIFSVDHPASQAWTRERFHENGLLKPPNLTYVPADLEERRVGEQLAACGFDCNIASFWSALGLMQYLERRTIDALIGFISTLAHGSEFVFSFAPPDSQLDVKGADAFFSFDQRQAALGEPWKSRLRPSDLIAELADLGFSDIFHLTPELARQRYFADQQEIQEPPCWDHLVAAII
jgi:methyltransferase (TIGR00027 family)